MSKTYRYSSLLVACSFVLLLSAAPASAFLPNVVGSWETTVSLDGAPVPQTILETYSIDGTVVASGPSAGSASITHGAWKRTGLRTFAASIVILLYDADGELENRLRGSIEGEVTPDGRNYTGAIASQLELPDGTVVATFGGTLSGKRIRVTP